ncbi:bifunctional DNA primase/polymerase [Thermus sp.]|uniref:bifunctional DNA primase/polymerase n=1 Tax=Thermus sp. TaxID=275 RepID=UPI00262ED78C|nr:bifunctional DNA primase/polymerase [Thermus sp.]MCX7850030.1 bifunctional DNA primase/polymerase [Thermus sp.]
MSSPLEAALFYARLGYPVLPLAPGEKRPHPRLAPQGLKGATAESATLEAWWRAEPRAGVGVLPPASVLVLDVDSPEALPRLLGEHPGLEGAPRQRTPKGGAHLFLRLPEGLEGALSATVRRLEGVDLRGMGRAYLVAAPTRLGDGRTYAWEVPLVPPEELPPVPEALLLRLLPPPPPPPREAVLREAVLGASPSRLRGLLGAYAERVAAAPQGQRHLTLVRYALASAGLVEHGLDQGEAWEALLRAGLACGLPQREVEGVLGWAFPRGKARPLPLEPQPPPLPPRVRWALNRRKEVRHG